MNNPGTAIINLTDTQVSKATDGATIIWGTEQTKKDKDAIYIVLAIGFALWCCA